MDFNVFTKKQRERIILEAIFGSGHPDSALGKRAFPTTLKDSTPIGKVIPCGDVEGVVS